MPDITITTFAERPELLEHIYDMPDAWPEFMNYDPVANAYFNQVAPTFPDYCVVATDADGQLIARGRSIPFAIGARDGLPDDGWDRVVIWAFADHRRGVAPDAASALDITIAPSHTGQGLSKVMLAAMRDAVGKQGLPTLFAPVRPTHKHLQPHTPMASYIGQLREDGLPVDPWLRIHVRAGGVVVSVAVASMTIPGSTAQWREWTGLPFDEDGDVVVPQALVPVRCNASHGYAVYVEPNVWVRHDLTARRPPPAR